MYEFLSKTLKVFAKIFKRENTTLDILTSMYRVAEIFTKVSMLTS